MQLGVGGSQASSPASTASGDSESPCSVPQGVGGWGWLLDQGEPPARGTQSKKSASLQSLHPRPLLTDSTGAGPPSQHPPFPHRRHHCFPALSLPRRAHLALPGNISPADFIKEVRGGNAHPQKYGHPGTHPQRLLAELSELPRDSR